MVAFQAAPVLTEGGWGLGPERAHGVWGEGTGKQTARSLTLGPSPWGQFLQSMTWLRPQDWRAGEAALASCLPSRCLGMGAGHVVQARSDLFEAHCHVAPPSCFRGPLPLTCLQ